MVSMEMPTTDGKPKVMCTDVASVRVGEGRNALNLALWALVVGSPISID